MGLRVRILGVRGFIPVPGRDTTTYGGNTVAVEVRGPQGERLILDAGSALFPLGRELMATEFGRGQGTLHMVITHSHFDHLMGFPFFVPVYIPGNTIHIYGASSSAVRLKDALEGQLNPHFSPIQKLENMGSNIHIHSVEDGESFGLGTLSLSFLVVPHGKTESLAVRVSHGKTAVVYAPVVGRMDTGTRDRLVSFIRDAALLLHDSSYAQPCAESEKYGVSTVQDAVAHAEAGGVKEMRLIHYAPSLLDSHIREMADAAGSLASSVVVLPATEGEEIVL